MSQAIIKERLLITIKPLPSIRNMLMLGVLEGLRSHSLVTDMELVKICASPHHLGRQ